MFSFCQNNINFFGNVLFIIKKFTTIYLLNNCGDNTLIVLVPRIWLIKKSLSTNRNSRYNILSPVELVMCIIDILIARNPLRERV